MTTKSASANTPIHLRPLRSRMLLGAGIATTLLLIFMIIGGKPNPGPKTWMILPFLTVPFGGALGGLVYYLLDFMRYQGGWRKSLANVLSLLIYILLLAATLIVGLNGPD
ncbi:potassium transporter KefB [Telluribacter humicola]|uniref:potassium transporter KefB n=1 Tax=Telluribacter humicola TaxID=1720261 RepID=UPI001A95A105|nr:potassium transporter KefB [Telluribacter humicola]